MELLRFIMKRPTVDEALRILEVGRDATWDEIRLLTGIAFAQCIQISTQVKSIAISLFPSMRLMRP